MGIKILGEFEKDSNMQIPLQRSSGVMFLDRAQGQATSPRKPAGEVASERPQGAPSLVRDSRDLRLLLLKRPPGCTRKPAWVLSQWRAECPAVGTLLSAASGMGNPADGKRGSGVADLPSSQAAPFGLSRLQRHPQDALGTAACAGCDLS